MVAVFLLQRALWMELLPAFAVFMALAAYLPDGCCATSRPQVAIARRAVLIFVAASYASVGRRTPSAFAKPGSTRARAWRWNANLPTILQRLALRTPPCSCTWETMSEPCSRRDAPATGDQRRQPPHLEAALDQDGLWERALADPASIRGFCHRLRGRRRVSSAVKKQELVPLAVIHASGQPRGDHLHGPVPLA